MTNFCHMMTICVGWRTSSIPSPGLCFPSLLVSSVLWRGSQICLFVVVASPLEFWRITLTKVLIREECELWSCTGRVITTRNNFSNSVSMIGETRLGNVLLMTKTEETHGNVVHDTLLCHSQDNLILCCCCNRTGWLTGWHSVERGREKEGRV